MLFIDTETTGIPKDWNAPYSDATSWPCSVQIAWSIYTKDGEEIRTENHYIGDDDFEISPESQQIHGITREFLLEHGESRKVVLSLLADDLRKYQPLVIGHFMQLDYHMLGVGFYRAGMGNPLPELPTFCTMNASANFLLMPRQRYLRLNELYERLFGTRMDDQHDALADAQATAACFFELVKRGDINDEVIAQQRMPPPRELSHFRVSYKHILLLVIFIIAVLLIYLL
ncbi:DNA polymerase-3 subunit epsilon [Pontibacter ummariensis]|uniref:DNA polymerase-3 subunit epsilon n=1 Tax=Pontibacter ummariensis TaxID=1610492 RepID=A0A239GKJ0_9BACT|nr:DNA polymerase-3 subunit epsilon [Pontibacter ummariensis]SNS68574.1 DNA polymerase-3 subunit epsilon [Pontibacter ummariensis]